MLRLVFEQVFGDHRQGCMLLRDVQCVLVNILWPLIVDKDHFVWLMPIWLCKLRIDLFLHLLLELHVVMG